MDAKALPSRSSKNKGKALAGKEVGGKAKTVTVAEKGVGVKNKKGKQAGKGKRQKLQPESENSNEEADTDEEVERDNISEENEVEEDDKTTVEESSEETKVKQISGKAGKKKSAAEGSNSKGGREAGKSKKSSKNEVAPTEEVEVAKDKKRKRRGPDREMAEAFLSPDNDFLLPGRRKETPSFRKVDLTENDYERIVGKRIKVFWPDSRRWYLGRIKSFDDVKKLHKILYEDGDKEDVDLKEERFELEVVTSDGFSISPYMRVNREKKVIGSSGAKANEDSKKDTTVHASATGTSSSAISPRNEKPAFRKVDLSENDNERIIGKRVKVYWSGSKKWFTGQIKSFNRKKKIHKILYEDGDKEEVDFRGERFELEVVPSDNFTTSSLNRKKKQETTTVRDAAAGEKNAVNNEDDSDDGDDPVEEQETVNSEASEDEVEESQSGEEIAQNSEASVDEVEESQSEEENAPAEKSDSSEDETLNVILKSYKSTRQGKGPKTGK